MARCGCSGGSGCSCLIRGGGGTSVTGAGTSDNPYVVSTVSGLTTSDSPTINLTLGGAGSVNDPWDIRADLTASLDDLLDVDASNQTVGYVLARQADGTFAMVPAATASPGVINVGVGIMGDGSSGNPLRVRLPANSGLIADVNGLRLASGTEWQTWTPVIYRTTGGTVNIGNSSLTGRYVQQGKTVHVSLELVVGSTFVVGSGRFSFSLPVAAAARQQALAGYAVLAEDPNGERLAVGKLEGDGRITRLNIQRGDGAYGVGASYPAWTANTKIVLTGTYEAA